MDELSKEAKKTTQVAISLGSKQSLSACGPFVGYVQGEGEDKDIRHGRPMGLVNCFWALSGIVDGIKGVQTGPGAMALTRMPLPTCWLLKPRVKLTMAPFVDV